MTKTAKKTPVKPTLLSLPKTKASEHQENTVITELARTLADLPDGACIVSDGSIIYTNKRGAKILGYGSTAQVPMRLVDLHHELNIRHVDGRKLVVGDSIVGLALHTKSAQQEIVVTDPTSGDSHTLRTIGTPIKDVKRKIIAVLIIFHDVSQQKQAEAEFRKNEMQLRFVVQNAADITTVFRADGHITYQSPSISRVLGWDSGARIGANIFDSALVHPDDHERKGIFLDKLVKARAGAKLKGEFRLRHADGSWRDIEAVGVNLLGDPNVRAIIMSSRDITRRKQTEAMLRDSEEHFRFMAELLPQKIFTADPEGKVTYLSPQWAEYTGVPLEKLKEQGTRQFLHPDDLPASMIAWKQAINGNALLEHGQRLRRADGQYRRHISHVRAMRNEKGEVVRWFGSLTDIEDIAQTAARKEELEARTAALTEQREQLIAINNAKDEFISLASHQLRTPATSVKQYIGMMLEGYTEQLSETQRDFLQRAYNSNERQINIVNDLLKVAMVDAGKVKPRIEDVDLSSLISETIEGQSAKFAEKDQNISFRNAKGTYVVPGDRDLLRMALENLIDNASKYSYEGKDIVVRLQKSKGNVDITVQDEGVGIPADKMDRLFHKFSRLDNPLSVDVGGTGLGLYWVRKIVDLHKGKISVNSEVGKGTAFTISLPS